jgi:hypothetical protein
MRSLLSLRTALAAGNLWTASPGSNSVLEYTPSQLVTGAPPPANSLAAPFPTQAQFDAAGGLWGDRGPPERDRRIWCGTGGDRWVAGATQRMLVTIRHGRTIIRRQKTIVLASGNYTLSRGQHATIQVRLSAGTLTALAQAGKHRLSGRAVVSVAGGTTLSRGVTLLARRPR